MPVRSFPAKQWIDDSVVQARRRRPRRPPSRPAPRSPPAPGCSSQRRRMRRRPRRGRARRTRAGLAGLCTPNSETSTTSISRARWLSRLLVREAQIDERGARRGRATPASPTAERLPHVVGAHDPAVAACGHLEAVSRPPRSRTLKHPSQRERAALRRPQRPEVDARVAGLEAPQEAPDRRMQREALQLVEIEQPVAADGLVVGDDVRERPVELGGEDDVHDVLRPEAALGGDRVDDRDGPSTGSSSPAPTSPVSSASSRRSACVRLSPPRTPPPGSSQCSTPRFSWRQSRIRPCQRRIAETRTRGSGLIAHPTSRSRRSPRTVAVELADLDELDGLRRGRRASWAIRMPGSTVNACSRSVLSRITLHLAAIARVDHARAR